MDAAGLKLVRGPANGFDLDNTVANGPDTLLMSYQGSARNRLDGIQGILGARIFPGEWLTVDGSLKAYQSILRTHPEATWPFLDDLIMKQQKGELTKYVEKATAKCRKRG